MPLLQTAFIGALSGLLFLLGAMASQAATDTGVYVEYRENDQPGAPVVDRWRLYGASHALVIGIDNYANGWPRLSNAIKDAELVAEELSKQGFDVELLTDVTGAELREALRRFFAFKGKDPQARLFVWYAGHGHSENGEGYLVPADAPLPGSPEFNYTALHMGDVGSMVRIARSKHVLAVFDSCFAGTIFSSQRARPPAAITAAVKRPTRQFLTSGDAEQKVSDDGTFRTLFLRAMRGEETADANRDGYLTGTELSFYLENRVMNLSQGLQTPRGGKLRDPKFDQGDFVFLLPGRREQPEVVATAAPIVMPPSASRSGDSGFTLNDLKKAEAAESWAQWQARMDAAFAEAEGFRGRTASMHTAWDRFLETFSQDNPFSDEDERLRAAAQANKAAIDDETTVAVLVPPQPEPEPAPAEAAVGVYPDDSVKDDWPFSEARHILAFATLEGESGLVSPVIQPHDHGFLYAIGEDVVLEARASNRSGGYVYVDYVRSDGNIEHLLPVSGHSENRFVAGQTMLIGNGARRYTAMSPYGTDMLVITQSPEPLFSTLRDDLEPAEDYFAALRRSLAAMNQRGLGHLVLSSHQFITTEAGRVAPARLETALHQPSGPSPTEIRDAQLLLADLGYTPGAVDGVMGRSTEEATRRFQRSLGVNEDGAVTEELLKRLREVQQLLSVVQPPTPPSNPVPLAEPVVGLYPGESFKDCADCPEMVQVPAGTFEMGSPPSEPGRGSDEGPQHRVTIARPFAVGRYEVTFAEWDACVADGGCNGYRPLDDGGGRGKRPVTGVSWMDAQAYTEWLSGKTGAEYRLPTEAEWEYVARAGTTTRYWWGDLPPVCRMGERNGAMYKDKSSCDATGTVPVGSFGANPYGLYDVHGNAWELVADCWHNSYKGHPVDGSSREEDNCRQHVLRGGSWRNKTDYLRASSRFFYDSDVRYSANGFRVAMSLK